MLITEFQNQQLEFDFVKELFTDLENFDIDMIRFG